MRFESIRGFRGNIKDNEKNCIHIVRHAVKCDSTSTQKRHQYGPLGRMVRESDNKVDGMTCDILGTIKDQNEGECV